MKPSSDIDLLTTTLPLPLLVSLNVCLVGGDRNPAGDRGVVVAMDSRTSGMMGGVAMAVTLVLVSCTTARQPTPAVSVRAPSPSPATRVPPAAAAPWGGQGGQAMVYDVDRGVLLHFGGGTSNGCETCTRYGAETWTWDGRE